MEFDKTDRYSFQQSALFNATMLMFVTDPAKATEMIDGLMPKDMQELVKKADDSLAELAKAQGADSDVHRQLAQLRAQLAAAQSSATNTPA